MKETHDVYAIIPIDPEDQRRFPLKDSLGSTTDAAWEKFCYPALRREGFEDISFEAKKVRVTIEVLEK